jgi:hypothetical protein
MIVAIVLLQKLQKKLLQRYAFPLQQPFTIVTNGLNHVTKQRAPLKRGII